jgi:Flp pilus assembly protein TadG
MRISLVKNRLTLSARKFVRRLIGDNGGFAMVEFAMVVPIMIMMLLGSVEISDALTVDGRVNIISSSISDIVARSTPVTKNDLKDVFKFSHVLIGKYDHTAVKTEIVSLIPDPATGDMKVDWSYNSDGGGKYPHDANYPGDWSGMASGANSLIIVKSTFEYTSPIGQYIHGKITLSHTTSNVSRLSAVKCTDC